MAEAITPTVVAARAALQDALPSRPMPPPLPDRAAELAVKLIVRWEITSQAYYARRLQGVICPGGASGPTWGIGWDGGHQTERENTEAWATHSEVERLATTSGAVGEVRCAAKRGTLRDVRTPYPLAEEVFIRYSLPKYQAIAVRKYGIALLSMPEGVRAALYSETYNRGGAIRGTRGKEQAAIRDVCLPSRDALCVAIQLEAMCRLWQGTPNGPGLCNRRFDEARVARGQPASV